MVTKVFCQNPFFLNGYGRFSLKKHDSTKGVFLQIPSLPLLFPSLILTYKVSIKFMEALKFYLFGLVIEQF